MPDEKPIPLTVQEYAAQFQDQNIQQALFYIRQLMVHCVLFVPGPQIPENAKALLYTQLLRIVKLYEPEAAK